MADRPQARDLTSELLQLRRGHGLHSDDVMQRVGPLVRAAAGIGEHEPTASAWQKLMTWLDAVIVDLPPDLRLSVQAALALAPAAQDRFLKDRMDWLGDQLGRDPRTATRRVESGFAKIAERVHGGEETPTGNAVAPDGWYVELLQATFLYHADPVRLIESRHIVATAPGLDRIAVSWSVPRRPDLPPEARIGVDLVYGGELVPDPSRSSPTYWAGHIRLAQPLKVGQPHSYQVEVTSLDRAFLRPYYVASPMRRLDEFVLRAKFEPVRPPERIWVLDGVPFRQIDDQFPSDRFMTADDVGEVSVSFTNLRPGLSYGLQWTS